MTTLIPALTALFALLFAALLFDQYRTRRGAYQLAWGVGALAFSIAAGAEALAAAVASNASNAADVAIAPLPLRRSR